MAGSSWTWQRISGAAGVLFVVYVVVVVVTVQAITKTPYSADPATYYRAYYTDNATVYHLITWFAALFWAFFFLSFASGVRTLLAPADADSGGTWVRLAFAGAVIAVAIGGSGLVYEEALSLGLASEASDAMVRGLSQIRNIVDTTVLNWCLAVFLVPASLIILKGAPLPRWMGWLGLVGAALLTVGAAWPLTGEDQGVVALIGSVGLGVFGLWVLAVGIRMLRMGSTATT